MQELERIAAQNGPQPNGDEIVPSGVPLPAQDTLDLGPQDSTDLSVLPADLDQWFTEFQFLSGQPGGEGSIYLQCGCPVLHLAVLPSRALLLPTTSDPIINHLRIEGLCVLAALQENCIQLGITRPMFCAEDAISPFFRPQLDPSSPDGDVVVSSLKRMFSTIKYDLRPSEAQITTLHHPYLDTLPFRDIRDNVIRLADQIDEDEFLIDSVTHWTCWGGVAGAHTGTPWDSRSWEASDAFLQKWSVVVGGPEGELARQSRWWKAMRGEEVTEVP